METECARQKIALSSGVGQIPIHNNDAYLNGSMKSCLAAPLGNGIRLPFVSLGQVTIRRLLTLNELIPSPLH